LNEIERTTVELGLSRGVRVFMLMGCDALKERTQVTSVEGLMSKMADAACSTDKRTPQEKMSQCLVSELKYAFPTPVS
jgi:hypothetical protein